MMTILDIIKGTPIWVWIILVFIIFKGFKALFNSEVKVLNIFLAPSFFTVWGFASIFKLENPVTFSITYIFFIIIGLGIGYLFWKKLTPSSYFDKEIGLFKREGSFAFLIIVIPLFLIKYAFGAYFAINGHQDTLFLIYVSISGIFSGMLWAQPIWLFSNKDFKQKNIK